ncbi:hypothetical protein PG996_004867 [Apiospora saccharicola]|uniref:Uncharacterized protein n=1 Tax=Apiospora saccharicola TaxID=335842 RepID=A0ABR1VJV1_9PEZI
MPGVTDLVAARGTDHIPPRRKGPWPVHDKSRTLLSGLILWLPSWRYLREDEDDEEPWDEDIYGHPVVIVSPESRHGMVTVLPLTSFGGTDLEDKHPYSSHIRKSYLPIYPSNPHPDSSRLLFLDPTWPNLLKNSYVNTSNRCHIRLEHLRPYDPDGPDFALSADSYQELITYCRYIPSIPLPEPEPEPEWQPRQTDFILAALPPSPDTPSPTAESSTLPLVIQAKSLKTSSSPPAPIDSMESRVTVPSGAVLINHYTYGAISAPTRSIMESTRSADGNLCISRRVWQACACRRENMVSNSSPHDAGSRRSSTAGWVVIVATLFCFATYAYQWATQEPISHKL